MEKINFNIFIEKCKNKNIAFLGSINKNIDFVKSAITNPDATINPGAVASSASPGAIMNPDAIASAASAASPGAIINPDATINNIFLLEKVENSIVDPPTNFFKYFLVLLSKCSLQSSFIATNFLKG